MSHPKKFKFIFQPSIFRGGLLVSRRVFLQTLQAHLITTWPLQILTSIDAIFQSMGFSASCGLKTFQDLTSYYTHLLGTKTHLQPIHSPIVWQSSMEICTFSKPTTCRFNRLIGPTIFWRRLNSPTIMGFDWVLGWVLSPKILKHPEISINIIYLKCHLLSSTLENAKRP